MASSDQTPSEHSESPDRNIRHIILSTGAEVIGHLEDSQGSSFILRYPMEIKASLGADGRSISYLSPFLALSGIKDAVMVNASAVIALTAIEQEHIDKYNSACAQYIEDQSDPDDMFDKYDYAAVATIQ